jgi:hypothetical protein
MSSREIKKTSLKGLREVNIQSYGFAITTKQSYGFTLSTQYIITGSRELPNAFSRAHVNREIQSRGFWWTRNRLMGSRGLKYSLMYSRELQNSLMGLRETKYSLLGSRENTVLRVYVNYKRLMLSCGLQYSLNGSRELQNSLMGSRELQNTLLWIQVSYKVVS